MKYMMLMYGAEGRWTDAEREACMIESMGICEQLASQGKFLAASPLHPVETARTVQVRDGKGFVTDGPFAETIEQLGGYYILDLADLDEAIAVASKLPPAKKGTVEIRPLLTLEGLPPDQRLPTDLEDSSNKPFMLLCYHNEEVLNAAGPAALKEAVDEAVALARSLNDAGRYVSASPLHPAETATSVRIRNGKREITDGPFAETHEVLGGYYVILAENQDEAMSVAARHSGARWGSVEVRPIFELANLKKTVAIA